MKTSSLFIVFIITIDIYGLSSSFVNSQAETCSSNLNFNGSVSFDTSSLKCLAVWDAQGFILRYSQTASSSNTWSFVLSAPNTNSYIAMGFSSNGAMVGSSAVVGWVPSNGVGVVKQYYLGGTSPSLVTPDQGNLQIVGTSTTIISQSSRLYLAFQLQTTQPQTRLLYSVGRGGALPSPPNYALSEHQAKVSTTINYGTGQSATGGSPYVRLRRSHGVLNMLGWGILMIIGAMVARYFKEKDPFWFYFHASIQLFGFILGLAGIICGFVLNNRLNAAVTTHKGLGIFILVLGCLQVMAFLARPNKMSKFRKYWNWYHQNVGRILVIFTIANIFYGIHLGENGHGWSVGYGVVLGILFIITVVLEIRIWIRK
ncbi:cytochrome b561 and DOMON domain-containing protein At3g07570 [Corylus avellana]|uniref:cytochrome b561 and DOMON domain-containing protein At3g07570 n=1 Tax=Corylus avellana TaxID=13451 RepID=UPI00286A7F5D|nr:cytochrome b561 and DOMON domain-containing protein At3g07570 [Corylus avellana]